MLYLPNFHVYSLLTVHESLPRYIKQAIELFYRGRVTIEPDDRNHFESIMKSWRIKGVFRKVITTKMEPIGNNQNQINLTSPTAATSDTDIKMELSKTNGDEKVKTDNEKGHWAENGGDAIKNHQKSNNIKGLGLPAGLDICRIPMASLANAAPNQYRPQLMDIQQSKAMQRINTPIPPNSRNSSNGSVDTSNSSIQMIQDFKNEKSCNNGNDMNNNKNGTNYEHDENTKENWQHLGNTNACNRSAEMNSNPIDVDED